MRIRVGKNIFFKITVNRLNDEPEDFTDARNVKLTINRKYSSYQVSPPLTIHDNIIEFEFVGGGNATSGQYEVHLYYEKLNEASVTGIDKFYLDFCNAFILVDLTCKEDAGFESESPSINLKGIIERNRDGKDGVTPRIDPETKRWMIGIEDTGIVAEGKDGLTPSIGENGNWWIGDVDTGKPSRGKAFEYSDFTPEEIKELQKPASDMINALDTLDKAVTANEQQRINNENTRVSSENARKESESLRKSAEDTRASNEEARKKAETGRASAEDNRVKAEQSRVESESNRVKAENTRVEKEIERQTAENTRDTNEQSRKESETNRVKAEEGRVTEFNRLKAESETATSNATEQANYAKQQGDNVAGTVNEIKTAQSGLLSRVNDYMYDMSGLLGKLAVKGAVGADEKQVTDGSYYDVNGNLVPSTSGGYAYQKLTVDPSKVYELNILFTGGNVSTLVLFDENDNVIHNSPRVAVSGNFVFTGITSIGITFDKNNESKYVIRSFDIQDLTTVLNTQQGNRALYVAAGAVYNQNTGFYELNGLTDITEKQMREIYVQTNPTKRVTDLCSVLNASSIRTNFPFLNRGGYKNIDCHAAFANCTNLEVVAFGARDGDNFSPSRIHYAFINCIKLREIKSILNVTSLESYNNKFLNTFSACRALEKILILNLKDNISFSNSPLLSLESLQYLITNAANTSPITVTVHADVYDKIQDEGQVDWHALIETAAAKQITFATA
jgi:hypothetical protein